MLGLFGRDVQLRIKAVLLLITIASSFSSILLKLIIEYDGSEMITAVFAFYSPSYVISRRHCTLHNILFICHIICMAV